MRGATQRLGGLPEQIVYAAEYTKVILASMNMFKGKLNKTLQDGHSDVGNPLDDFSTFHSACRAAEASHPLATELLFQCSMFDCTDIPMEILKEGYDPFDDQGRCCVHPSLLPWMTDSRSFDSSLPRSNAEDTRIIIPHNPRQRD